MVWQLLLVAYGLFLSVFSAPWTPENAAQNVNFNPDERADQYFGKWPGHTYYPSPVDWRSATVYQFVTDRFANGDPTNDNGQFGGVDMMSVGSRHGGDFRGIAGKLDYVASLGFNAIWISPIFQNGENSYHGYAQRDFTLIDDRLGTLEDLRYLVTEAHRRSIHVIVDIVVNHMANLLYFEGFETSSAPFKMHADEYKSYYRNPNETYVDFVVDNTFLPDGKYCPVYGTDGEEHTDTSAYSGSYWNSDFHHNGDLSDYSEPYQNDLGKIYGIMDDLRTTHSRVQAKIAAMTKALIASTDIDGIRMDTPMQVPLSFFQYWVPQVKEHALSLGKKNFFIFAEFYTTKPFAADMTGRGKTPSMYGNPAAFIDPTGAKYAFDGGINYPSWNWFSSTIKQWGNDVNGLLNSYEEDLKMFDWWNPMMPGEQTLAYRHCNFFNNHDQWRMASDSPDYGFLKQDLASFILFTFPGLPLFYYGDDQGLLTLGTALDGWSREDFPTSLAWNNITVWGNQNRAIGDNFDMASPHFILTKRLNWMRTAYGFYDCDDVVERYTQPGAANGLFFYSKRCAPNAATSGADDSAWVLAGFNSWKERQTAQSTFQAFANAGTIVNALDTNETYDLDANGWFVTPPAIDGEQFKLFVRKEHYIPEPPVVTGVTPAHDVAVVVSSERDMPSVTFTVEFSGIIKGSLSDAFSSTGPGMTVTRVQCTVGEYSTVCSVQAAVSAHGVHFLVVEGSKVVAASGAKMDYNFVSRIRVGTSSNVIVNPNAVFDDSLAVRSSATTIRLNHKALGAEKVRVYCGGGGGGGGGDPRWGQWELFRRGATAECPSGTQSVTVQYFVDYSTAYFVEGSVSGRR